VPRALLLPTGLALLPANDRPPPADRRAAAGAQPDAAGHARRVAAGLFEIARKISTVPLIVRQAFQYVMAPLSSAQAKADRARSARSIPSPAGSRPRWWCRSPAC
jgi:hypothetical protein